MITDSLLDLIRPGSRVTILVPSGIGRYGQEWKESTGRAVMRGPAGWVLNMGGRYGTPGVATEENIVKVKEMTKREQLNKLRAAGQAALDQELKHPSDITHRPIVNHAQVRCTEACYIQTSDGEERYEVLIEEASPDDWIFARAVRDRMSNMGLGIKVDVRLEW